VFWIPTNPTANATIVTTLVIVFIVLFPFGFGCAVDSKTVRIELRIAARRFLAFDSSRYAPVQTIPVRVTRLYVSPKLDLWEELRSLHEKLNIAQPRILIELPK
jgi:hypothetical protein